MNKIIELPIGEIYCIDCETTNFFYSDDKPPYKCARCKKEFKLLMDGGKLIESPSANVYCDGCKTTTKFYKADAPPYLCAGCGREFQPNG